MAEIDELIKNVLENLAQSYEAKMDKTTSIVGKGVNKAIAASIRSMNHPELRARLIGKRERGTA